MEASQHYNFAKTKCDLCGLFQPWQALNALRVSDATVTRRSVAATELESAAKKQALPTIPQEGIGRRIRT